MGELLTDVNAQLRDIVDFPKPGIVFKDITPVLGNPEMFGRVLQWMADGYENVDKIVGMDARGFIFGGALVPLLDAGFVPARK